VNELPYQATTNIQKRLSAAIAAFIEENSGASLRDPKSLKVNRRLVAMSALFCQLHSSFEDCHARTSCKYCGDARASMGNENIQKICTLSNSKTCGPGLTPFSNVVREGILLATDETQKQLKKAFLQQ
jgi:hypothetical protein